MIEITSFVELGFLLLMSFTMGAGIVAILIINKLEEKSNKDSSVGYIIDCDFEILERPIRELGEGDYCYGGYNITINKITNK